MSVTSREVAAILSTAGPMAPPSDDDDNYSEYDGDDVSPLEELQHRRLSSAMQLLRVSSASPLNCSSGSSTDLATPPHNGDVQLTPYQRPRNAARLNNGWSSRRADEFRPYQNGVDDRKDRLDPGHVRSTVGSVGGLCRQHLALFDLLTTHHLVLLTLEVRLNNGHYIRGPPFQVSSREHVDYR